MVRVKKIDFMRTEFIVEVEDTHFYHRDEGIASLRTKTSVAGIPIDVQEIGDGAFKIIVRPHFPKYAIQDYLFVTNNIKSQYGRIHDVHLMARPDKAKAVLYNIEYTLTDTELKPLKEWEQSYQHFDLDYQKP